MYDSIIGEQPVRQAGNRRINNLHLSNNYGNIPFACHIHHQLLAMPLIILQVEMFAKTKETFGSLDIVCNNAGIVDEIDWEKLLSINLVSELSRLHGDFSSSPALQNAVILGTKTAIEHMSVNRGGRGGVVINVSSVAGKLH